MRYRIVLDPNTAKWLIEIDTFMWRFWTPIYKGFASYHDAQDWATQVGLDNAYTKQDTKTCAPGTKTQSTTYLNRLLGTE